MKINFQGTFEAGVTIRVKIIRGSIHNGKYGTVRGSLAFWDDTELMVNLDVLGFAIPIDTDYIRVLA